MHDAESVFHSVLSWSSPLSRQTPGRLQRAGCCISESPACAFSKRKMQKAQSCRPSLSLTAVEEGVDIPGNCWKNSSDACSLEFCGLLPPKAGTSFLEAAPSECWAAASGHPKTISTAWWVLTTNSLEPPSKKYPAQPAQVELSPMHLLQSTWAPTQRRASR